MGITTILIVVTVFSSLSIIVLALMQTIKGDMGSAFGGGGSQSMFGSRGSANFLSRMTSIMVAVFFISCLTLAYIYAQRNESASVVDQSVLETQPTTSSEVPILEDEEAGLSSDMPELDSELPVIDSEVPAIDADEAVDQAEDAVEAAADAVQDDLSTN